MLAMSSPRPTRTSEPRQRVFFLVTLWQKICQLPLFKDDVVKAVFDNLRNVLIASVVIWAGFMMGTKNPSREPYPEAEGWFLIFIGFLLLVFNAVHGIKKLDEATSIWPRRGGRVVFALFALLYFVLFTGVFVIVLHTRGGSLLPP